jgi:hypothetical protein
MEITLVLSSLAASIASGLFLAAGLNLRARRVSAEDQRAVDLFSLWWLGLAAYAAAGASQDLVAASGLRPFVLFLVLSYVQMVALCIGLWGLMYHVAHVVTGRRRLLLPLSGFYVAYYAVILFLVTRSLPSAVEAHAWRTGLVYGDPALDAFAVALLLVIPPLVGGGMYLLLSLQARGGAQRLRILLVTGSTFAWSAGLLAREAEWASLLPALLGVLAGCSVSWAYQPPGWLRRRLDALPAA